VEKTSVSKKKPKKIGAGGGRNLVRKSTFPHSKGDLNLTGGWWDDPILAEFRAKKQADTTNDEGQKQ